MARSDILPMSHAEYNVQLFRSSMFSDCVIKCQDRMWHLHKAILSPRCEFFWKCFDGPFEESSSTVVMDEEDPDTLERLLLWIYTLQWPSAKYTSEPWTSDLMLYMVADKYDLSALAEKAKSMLLQKAKSCADTKSEICHTKFLANLNDLVELLGWLFNDLLEQADLDDLREKMLSTMSAMIAIHVRKEVRLEELMTTTPGFAARLVETMLCTRCSVSNNQQNMAAVDGFLDKSVIDCATSNGRNVPPGTKQHIPLNEDSEDDLQ